MRLSEISKYGYQNFLNLFSQLNGPRINYGDPFAAFAAKKSNAFNQARQTDKDDDIVNSHGVSGMCIDGKDPSEYHQIIGISEEGKQTLFDMVKSEFIENYGVLNGDTTRRSDVYADYQKSIPKEDRLKATWTLGQLEQEYRDALLDTVRSANPDWKLGYKFDTGILEHMTREDASGEIDRLSRQGFDARA